MSEIREIFRWCVTQYGVDAQLCKRCHGTGTRFARRPGRAYPGPVVCNECDGWGLTKER